MLTSYFCVCKLWVLSRNTHTSDQLLASQQRLRSCKFVLHVSGQWTDNGILMKLNF